MPKIIPIGNRCFVKDIEPTVGLVARAARAGLHAVILEENVPKPTSGIVVAVGTDPEIQSHVHIGDTVCFSRLAGVYQQVEGEEYRCLQLSEIISCITPDPPEAPLAGQAKPLESPPAKASLTSVPSQNPESSGS